MAATASTITGSRRRQLQPRRPKAVVAVTGVAYVRAPPRRGPDVTRSAVRQRLPGRHAGPVALLAEIDGAPLEAAGQPSVRRREAPLALPARVQSEEVVVLR